MLCAFTKLSAEENVRLLLLLLIAFIYCLVSSGQTHCAHAAPHVIIIIWMSDYPFIARYLIFTEVVYSQLFGCMSGAT